MKSFLLILFLCGNALSQTPRAIDWARMQRDLDIMEMVLDRLLNENSGPMIRLGGHAARGVYLPEFGVLFQVPQARSMFSYFEFHTEQQDQFLTPETEGQSVTAPKQVKPSRTAVAGELTEFFARYADAIGQLRGNDRIAVYRGAGPELSVFFDFPGAGGQAITASEEMLAWVRKSDLDALQTGKLSAAEFEKRLSFTTQQQHIQPDQREPQRDIDRLAGIFEVALGLPPGVANGVHIEQYGAVLFARADLSPNFPRRSWNWSTEAQHLPASEREFPSSVKTIEEYLRATERAARERESTWHKEYAKFKENAQATLAEYGHSLRGVSADECLALVVDLPNAPPTQPRQLVCAVKKRVLEQYHDRKISREQLRKVMALHEH